MSKEPILLSTDTVIKSVARLVYPNIYGDLTIMFINSNSTNFRISQNTLYMMVKMELLRQQKGVIKHGVSKR